MPATVVGSGTKFLPESAEIMILTSAGAGSLTPTLANMTDASALNVSLAVANWTSFTMSTNMVSDSTWGPSRAGFMLAGIETFDGTPTIEFWADLGGDDISGDLTKGLTVSIIFAPEGLAATDVVRIYAGSVAGVAFLDEKGSPDRVRVQFAIQDYDLSYTVPGA